MRDEGRALHLKSLAQVASNRGSNRQQGVSLRATQRHRGAPLPARFGSVLAPHQSTRMGSRGKERGDARGRIVWWQRPEELRYTCVVCVRCRRSTRCRRCKRGMGRGRSCGAGGRFEADGVEWCGAGVYQTRRGQVRGGMLAAEGGGDNYVAELVAHSSRRSRRNRTGAD